MNTYTLTPEERFNLILECRNSGLEYSEVAEPPNMMK